MKHLLFILTLGIFFAATDPARAQDWLLTEAPTNLVWSSIACSADGSRLVAGTYGSGIYLSTDGGYTWSPGSAPTTNSTCSSVVSSADGTRLAALDNGYVYISADAGITWTSNQLSSSSLDALASSADGTELVVTAAGGVVYASENAGMSWSSQTLPGVSGLSVASSADGTKLVAASGTGTIFSSTNSGATWQISGAPTNRIWVSIASSADGTKLVAGADEAIFTSMDSGTTWTSNSIPDGLISCVAVSADGTKMAAVTENGVIPVGGSPDGIILISTNSGVTWTSSLSPDGTWRGLASSADGSKLFAARSDTFTALPPLLVGGIYNWLTTPNPALKLIHSAGNSLISWIVPSTGFTLQQNPGLNPNAWTDVSVTPALNFTNLNLEAAVSPTNGQCFYRLIYTPGFAPDVQVVEFDPPLEINAFADITDTNQSFNLLSLDLNFDGTNDFNLAYGANAFGLGGIEMFFSSPTRVVTRLPWEVAALPLGTIIGGSLSQTNSYQWSAGDTNQDIPLQFGASELEMIYVPNAVPNGASFNWPVTGPLPPQYFPPVEGDVPGKEGAIGVEFYINGQPYYGYLHFDFRSNINSPFSGVDGVIYGWAYQTKPNVPIVAAPIDGQSGTP